MINKGIAVEDGTGRIMRERRTTVDHGGGGGDDDDDD